MKKSSKPRLTLSRETIRNLETGRLNRVAGGDTAGADCASDQMVSCNDNNFTTGTSYCGLSC